MKFIKIEKDSSLLTLILIKPFDPTFAQLLMFQWVQILDCGKEVGYIKPYAVENVLIKKLEQ